MLRGASVRIHYFHPDGNCLGWNVYAFGDTTEDTSDFNGGPEKVTGQDSFGAYTLASATRSWR